MLALVLCLLVWPVQRSPLPALLFTRLARCLRAACLRAQTPRRSSRQCRLPIGTNPRQHLLCTEACLTGLFGRRRSACQHHTPLGCTTWRMRWACRGASRPCLCHRSHRCLPSPPAVNTHMMRMRVTSMRSHMMIMSIWMHTTLPSSGTMPKMPYPPTQCLALHRPQRCIGHKKTMSLSPR